MMARLGGCFTRTKRIGVCKRNSDHAAAGDTGSKPWTAVFTVELKCGCWCDAAGSVVGAGDTWLVLCHGRARFVTLAKGTPSSTPYPRAKHAASQQSHVGNIIKHTLAALQRCCSRPPQQKSSICQKHPGVLDRGSQVRTPDLTNQISHCSTPGQL